MITFFTLTGEDLNQIPTTSADYNRLGFALQLSALRFLGFCPDELMTTPSEVVTYVAKQLKIDSPSLDAYGQREHTRTDHLQQIRQYLGFRKASEADLTTLLEWLLQRALEHDKPTLLFQMATDWLYKQKIVRPGVTILERMVMEHTGDASGGIRRVSPKRDNKHRKKRIVNSIFSSVMSEKHCLTNS